MSLMPNSISVAGISLKGIFLGWLEFFLSSGDSIPKSLTHPCLIMLPKIDNPVIMSDLWPISLGNVSCKIISKLLNNRLAPLLPNLISPNQSGFIKSRSISENVMLVQELVHNIPRSNKDGNVVFKLDMSKAYYRVSWPFLCQILRALGFDELWIDMVWRLVSNIWYSININGVGKGVFPFLQGT